MTIIFKFIFFIFIAVTLIAGDISLYIYYEVTAILMLIATNTYREKFAASLWTAWFDFVIIFIVSSYNPIFLFLLPIPVFDLIVKKIYAGLLPVLFISYHHLEFERLFEFLFVVFLCIFFAYYVSLLSNKEQEAQQGFDSERILRYRSEGEVTKLLETTSESTRLAEVNERNRIAREIHDNVGHSIAGILIQLQAADKLNAVDTEKADLLLKESISQLAASLVSLRETLHNIKPAEELGIDHIQKIVHNFVFCSLDFDCRGNFNDLPPGHLEVIAAVVKESLTNIIKHSRATEVKLSIDANEKHTRIYIKDNGLGCANIKEGLGLRSMRIRIKNAGGSLSTSGSKGFLLVCLIPRAGQGRAIFENIDRR